MIALINLHFNKGSNTVHLLSYKYGLKKEAGKFNCGTESFMVTTYLLVHVVLNKQCVNKEHIWKQIPICHSALKMRKKCSKNVCFSKAKVGM